ncbi:MAG: hypothetical protein LCH56_03945 [Proteobacteria bacterium]|nr:hypothetical protein [Pseudomonadota bacterium]
MTTVPPPNVALPQVLAAAAAPTIVIAQPPPAIAALPVGTTIEAMVLPPPPNAPIPATAPNAPAQQAIVLHTAVGDIAVRLPIVLPEKAHVDLEIVRATPQQVTIRITTVDGAATAQYLAQNRVSSPPVTPAPSLTPPTQILPGPQPLPLAATWTPNGPTPFVQAGTISAIITQAPAAIEAAPNTALQQPATPAAPPTLASLPVGSGSELALKIVSMQLPNAAPVTAPPPLLAQAPTVLPQPPITPSAPPVVTTTAPTLTSPQPGLVLTSAQPAVLPQPPAHVQSTRPLATVTGTVIANADSIPIVEIEDRQVQLNVRANLPVGTKIVFEVTATTPPRVGAALPLPLPPSAMPMSGPAGAYTGWPTLIESISVLQRSDPIAAQQLAQAIPDGGPRTAAAVISFVQAMRTGDARQWPGDTTLRALEKAGPRGAHLAGTLSGEVGELSARVRDGGAEWRALPVPWNAGGQIDRIALITRREGDADTDGAGGRKGSATRFLIDLNLSRLGAMQLDGMFKKELRAFDMVLRTKDALPEEMRRGLTGIFTSANGAMGLKGGLTFQVTKKFADPLNVGNSPDKAGLWA